MSKLLFIKFHKINSQTNFTSIYYLSDLFINNYYQSVYSYFKIKSHQKKF